MLMVVTASTDAWAQGTLATDDALGPVLAAPDPAAPLPGPVPDELIVEEGGLKWVWASPCNGGCSDPDPAYQAGWRNPTDDELLSAPSCDAFVRPDGSIRCASEYFDPNWPHCDLSDCEQGFVSGGANWEPPYQTCINGTNDGNCESWFVMYSVEKELTSGPDRDGSVSYEDFSDSTGLTLNGSAAQAVSVLRLTPATTGQAGSAFTSNPLALGPNGSFSTQFAFRISSPGGISDSDGYGADGITFTLHNDADGDMALGDSGGYMGYSGIGNSLTVEFDTWDNGGGFGDLQGNHVGTATNGAVGSGPTVNIAARMNDGATFYSWIDYDGVADQLEVRLADSPVRPAAPTFSQGGLGLAGLLGGTSAYVGFTAATGQAYNIHDILYWHFSSAIDLVVPINVEDPTAYDFTITWNGNTPVWIYDRVPAEWDVTDIEHDGTGLPLDCAEATDFVGPYGAVEISRGGKKGKNCSSDTGFRWMPGEDNTLNVQTLARCHANRNNNFCRPTACGALYLNYGAIALARDPETDALVLDDEGDPIVVAGPSDDICLAAVDDVNGDGTFTWDGSGDEDSDGLSDLEEACEVGTDPCVADTDGDGVPDGADECPLEGPPDPSAGEFLDARGCISHFLAGTFPVRGTWYFDLDLGSEVGSAPPADVFFNRVSQEESNFYPQNGIGALTAIFGAAQPSKSECMAAPLSGSAVSFFDIGPYSPSLWMCAITDEGRYSAFRILSGTADPNEIWYSQDIVIEFVTWP